MGVNLINQKKPHIYYNQGREWLMPKIKEYTDKAYNFERIGKKYAAQTYRRKAMDMWFILDYFQLYKEKILREINQNTFVSYDYYKKLFNYECIKTNYRCIHNINIDELYDIYFVIEEEKLQQEIIYGLNFAGKKLQEPESIGTQAFEYIDFTTINNTLPFTPNGLIPADFFNNDYSFEFNIRPTGFPLGSRITTPSKQQFGFSAIYSYIERRLPYSVFEYQPSQNPGDPAPPVITLQEGAYARGFVICLLENMRDSLYFGNSAQLPALPAIVITGTDSNNTILKAFPITLGGLSSYYTNIKVEKKGDTLAGLKVYQNNIELPGYYTINQQLDSNPSNLNLRRESESINPLQVGGSIYNGSRIGILDSAPKETAETTLEYRERFYYNGDVADFIVKSAPLNTLTNSTVPLYVFKLDLLSGTKTHTGMFPAAGDLRGYDNSRTDPVPVGTPLNQITSAWIANYNQ